MKKLKKLTRMLLIGWVGLLAFSSLYCYEVIKEQVRILNKDKGNYLTVLEGKGHKGRNHPDAQFLEEDPEGKGQVFEWRRDGKGDKVFDYLVYKLTETTKKGKTKEKIFMLDTRGKKHLSEDKKNMVAYFRSAKRPNRNRKFSFMEKSDDPKFPYLIFNKRDKKFLKAEVYLETCREHSEDKIEEVKSDPKFQFAIEEVEEVEEVYKFSKVKFTRDEK